MQKIPTIFQRDWDGLHGPPGRAILPVMHPDCEWVFDGDGHPTRKLDGTSCMIRGGVLFKRRETRHPEDAEDPSVVVVSPLDEETGKIVLWVPVSNGPEDKWHWAAFAERATDDWEDGTYELVGPHVQGNPERLDREQLIAHAAATPLPDAPLAYRQPLDVADAYDELRGYLTTAGWEGIVWHHDDGRMAKVKARDFGVPRPRPTTTIAGQA